MYMYMVVTALHGHCNYHVSNIVIVCTLGMYETHTETDLLLTPFILYTCIHCATYMYIIYYTYVVV